ncbi:hypothetical protein B0A49_09002 [Cryomyces minteri]|uniref:Laccase-2 n=1 Tax=Cryomyces minteri TaxID=331657 RepID=A0A4U0XHG5_9PEZI|nr:hypothetical protein B0A49_09002 [Cryomyces minteri]
MPNGFPWGTRTPQNSDATNINDIPNTGVTRYYDFSIARAVISPDGVPRDSILVNGQFPGPTIEANWGDYIQVTAHNQIENPVEGTSMHWHGMMQKETPWYDGVPSISQCPIAPGATFTYRFRADQYGSSWYHAHYSAQYNAGVLGPMVIYGPTNLQYDIDIGPIILSDWYHIPYFQIVENTVGTDTRKLPPVSDNNLINGRNNFDCSTLPKGSNLTCTPNAGFSKFMFQKGKSHRLRLVNTGADGVQKFSIDGHNLTIIAQDMVPVKPYNVSVVTLGVAQRTDVVVYMSDDEWDAIWMRAEIFGGVTCGGSSAGLALAAIYFDNATETTSTIPTTTSEVKLTGCANDYIGLAEPEYAILPSNPTFTEYLAITLTLNETGHFQWQINGQTFRANFNYPLLQLASQGNTSYPNDPEWNVYNYGQNQSMRYVIQNETPFTHPFHIHGHNMYILDEGPGPWNGTYDMVNRHNPTRRDTQIIRGFGYLVMQIEADNPGVWPFHCHVAWHLSGGLSINIMSRPSDIPSIPDIMPQTCNDWDDYSAANVVHQIDAGS